MRTLVLGGARSGKSGVAESLIGDRACTYVATARAHAGDTDFSARIAQHRARRPAHWATEEKQDLVEVLSSPPKGHHLLVDDMGTWLAAQLDGCGGWEQPRDFIEPEVTRLCQLVAAFPPHNDLVIVSPEVGMGIIPEHRSGRLFRDELGRLNAELATVCDRVLLVVAGLTLPLK